MWSTECDQLSCHRPAVVTVSVSCAEGANNRQRFLLISRNLRRFAETVKSFLRIADYAYSADDFAYSAADFENVRQSMYSAIWINLLILKIRFGTTFADDAISTKKRSADKAKSPI